MEKEKRDEYFIPEGLVANLYKYFVRQAGQFEAAEDFFRNPPDGEHNTFVTFGNFDRISFEPVEKFQEYRQEACKGYTWIGNRQSIMLYPLSKERQFAFREKSSENKQLSQVDRFGLIKNEKFEPIGNRFLMLTFLYVAGKAKASVKSYARFLEYCKQGIDGIVEAYNTGLDDEKKLRYEIFGTFNSAEVAVIWACDSYVDVLYLVDNLRHMRLSGLPGEEDRRMFISSYTFAAVSKLNLKELNSKGGMLIHLAGRTLLPPADDAESSEKTNYQRLETYAEALKKEWGDDSTEELMYCLGEYDIIVRGGPKYLPAFYQNPKPDAEEKTDGKTEGTLHDLNIHNKVFSGHFLESSTQLYYKKEDVRDLNERMKNQWAELLSIPVNAEDICKAYSVEQMDVLGRLNAKTENGKKNIRQKFLELRKCIAGYLPTSSGFFYTMDMLYADYVQCVTTSVNHLWVKDFDAQFETMLEVLATMQAEAIAKDDEQNNGTKFIQKFLQEAEKMFQVLQQQIYHISDAGKMFFEEPRSHFSDTGQWDLIMHTYYGVLKSLLAQVYLSNEEKNSVQSEIYPIINFVVSSYLSSELYWESDQGTDGGTQRRFLAIKLPYSAWESLDHYVPMLVHELYHYVAPKQRNTRNYYFGCILMPWLFVRTAEEYWGVPVKDEDEEKAYRAARFFISQRLTPDFIRYFSAQLKPECEASLFHDITGQELTKGEYYNRLIKCLKDAFLKQQFMETVAELMNNCLEELALSSDWKTFLNGQAKKETAEEYLHVCIERTNALRQNGVEANDPLNDEQTAFIRALSDVGMLEMQFVFEMLKELFPDAAMVDILDLSPAAYLLQFAVHQNNRAIHPSEIDRQTQLRIACILDHLTGWAPFRNHQFTPDFEDEFLQLYNAACSEVTEQPVTGNDWISFFHGACQAYDTVFVPYRDFVKELIEAQFCPCVETETSETEFLKKNSKEYYEILRDKNGEELDSAIFRHSIEFIQRFQLQYALYELRNEFLNEQETLPPENAQRVDLTKFVVGGGTRLIYRLRIEDLHKQLTGMVETMRKNHASKFPGEKMQLWFRGSNNVKHNVLPSVMVRFTEDSDAMLVQNTGKNKIGTLWEYQRYLLERFKYKADGAPEVIQGGMYTALEYLSLMQHYRLQSNLLDWSEDAYTSLYFALESYVDNDKDKKEKDKDKTAALYILDPMMYNRARKLLMQYAFCRKRTCKKINTCRTFCNMNSVNPARVKPYFDTCQGWDGRVPNLSLRKNQPAYWMFLGEEGAIRPGAALWNVLVPNDEVSITRLCEVDPALDSDYLELYKHLPIAVYSSRLNPRIRAQSGLFVAYDLTAPPLCGDGFDGKGASLFRYLALNVIQRDYLKLFPEEPPFMLQLNIEQTIKDSLGMALRYLGINRYRIYPELENLKGEF